MKKSEIFQVILDKVSEVCEVREDLILHGSKLQAVVDARILAVQYMRRHGLTADDIALVALRLNHGDMSYDPPMKEIKTKAKNLHRVFSTYSDRCLDSKAFRLMSIEIKEFCRDAFPESEE